MHSSHASRRRRLLGVLLIAVFPFLVFSEIDNVNPARGRDLQHIIIHDKETTESDPTDNVSDYSPRPTRIVVCDTAEYGDKFHTTDVDFIYSVEVSEADGEKLTDDGLWKVDIPYRVKGAFVGSIAEAFGCGGSEENGNGNRMLEGGFDECMLTMSSWTPDEMLDTPCGSDSFSEYCRMYQGTIRLMHSDSGNCPSEDDIVASALAAMEESTTGNRDEFLESVNERGQVEVTNVQLEDDKNLDEARDGNGTTEDRAPPDDQLLEEGDKSLTVSGLASVIAIGGMLLLGILCCLFMYCRGLCRRGSICGEKDDAQSIETLNSDKSGNDGLNVMDNVSVLEPDMPNSNREIDGEKGNATRGVFDDASRRALEMLDRTSSAAKKAFFSLLAMVGFTKRNETSTTLAVEPEGDKRPGLMERIHENVQAVSDRCCMRNTAAATDGSLSGVHIALDDTSSKANDTENGFVSNIDDKNESLAEAESDVDSWIPTPVTSGQRANPNIEDKNESLAEAESDVDSWLPTPITSVQRTNPNIEDKNESLAEAESDVDSWIPTHVTSGQSAIPTVEL